MRSKIDRDTALPSQAHILVGAFRCTVDSIHADIYFMGVTGIHPRVGLTTGDFEEAHVKKALSASAAETIVLASPEKLSAVSAYAICALSEITGMIVAANTKPGVLKPYSRAGITITKAKA